MAANAAGDTFPIWGSCLGFEWIMKLASEDDHVLRGGFDSENLTLPLNLTAAAATSRVLSPAATTPVPFEKPAMSVLDALKTLPITMNNHVEGLTPSAFASNERLSTMFHLLSTNADRHGREFVSMVEGATAPVWATQWHPEKNIYEQGVRLPSGTAYEVIQHTRPAIAAAAYLANFFVDQARASSHRFRSAEDEWDRLIYKYTTSLNDAPEFVQIYLFDY